MNEQCAYFFKGISNIYELEKKTQEAINKRFLGQRYTVIKKYILENHELESFGNNLNGSCEIIKDMTHKLKMSSKGEYVCISISSAESSYEILVNSNEYSYARLVAIIQKGICKNGL